MDSNGGAKELRNSRAHSRTSVASSHSHQSHHSHCASNNPAASQPSNFLQERIQQRRTEKKISTGNMSTSTSRTQDRENMIRNSSVRRSTPTMIQRGRSNSEDELDGMGAKETDRAIESLKKQNWDLKLELYHRRERQAVLEEKAKRLSEEAKRISDEHDTMLAQSTETMKLYDDLARELDKRDKALIEAIDMIVDLQSKVEELEHEKEIARLLEADFRSSTTGSHLDGPLRTAVPVLSASNSPSLRPVTDVASRLDDPKTLERMSSFLSEHGDRTVNLRDMILNNKSSFVHMRKVSDMSVVPSELNRIASPSLSVLSESSFMSVYGNNDRIPDPMPSHTDTEEPMISDKNTQSDDGQKQSHSNNGCRSNSITGAHLTGDASKRGASLTSQIRHSHNVINIDSPLQRIARLEDKLLAVDTSRPFLSSHGRLGSACQSDKPKSQGRAGHEKQESPRKVVTISPYAADFANARMLPPTPDTTTSSMLRRYQNSNDTLLKESRIGRKENFTYDTTPLPRTALLQHLSPRPVTAGRFSSQVVVPAVTSQKDLPEPGNGIREKPNYHPQAALQRPRSADETTISRHRANSWGSRSDSDGGVDTRAEADGIDYWMHESAQPVVNMLDDRISSPDLFSFPTESGNWEPAAIFGAMRGTGFTPVPDLRRDPMDEFPTPMIILRGGKYHAPDPKAHDGGIPAPTRRSSRSARTGSMVSASNSPEDGKIKQNLFRGNSTTPSPRKTRSNSVDCADVCSSVRSQQNHRIVGAGDGNNTRYPPIVGQSTKLRKSGALTRLFRRSIGGSQDLSRGQKNGTETNSPATQAHSIHGHTQTRSMSTGRCSVPPPAILPWNGAQTILRDDLPSATPPPIMRNRGTPVGSRINDNNQEPMTPRRAQSAVPRIYQQEYGEVECLSNRSTPQSGARRKWLGLGRRSSLMNRNI